MRCLLVLILAACAAPEPEIPVYRIAGRVRMPVDAGVVVITLDSILVTIPDAYGDFRFDDVPAGRYTLTVQPVFPTLEGVLGRGVDVVNANVDNLLFDLTPTGRVVGRVLDDFGMPITGARVFVAGTAAVTYSLADGSFTLEPVPLGTQTVVAQAQGFLPDRNEEVEVLPGDAAFSQVLLILREDPAADDTQPNLPPVIAALQFAAKDTSGQNPRPIPAASAQIPELVHAQSTLQLSVQASDPEGQALSYLWSADKGVLVGEGSSVEWTAPNAEAEVVVVVFDADGGASTARQRFVLPRRSIRSASIYGHEIFYSETRQNDDRDIVGFNLDTGVERTVYEAVDEQHGPRVVGDALVFADQVFTFVQPLVFRTHVLGLGPMQGLNLTYGQTLTPSDTFLIDYRLYTPLTDGLVTYLSQSSQLAPLGIGTFDPIAGTYAPFSVLGATPVPAYPCFVRHAGSAYGVNGVHLYEYVGSTATLVADIPGQGCLEMQAANGRAALRTDDVFDPLVIVTLGTGAVQTLGTNVQSFALFGDSVAYTDTRGGVTGVYLHDLAAGSEITVAAKGFFDRRVLELNAEYLLFGETDPANNVSAYSSDSLQVYTR